MKLAAVLLFLASTCAYAHPPKSIEIKQAGKKIDIVIAHPVRDALKHYIDDVRVWLNGELIITQRYKTQPDGKTQLAGYIIPELKKGDKIKVKANCNMGGSLEKELSAD